MSPSRPPGPVINRNKLSVLGTYLLLAMQLAGVSISEVARRCGLAPSTVAKLMKGQRTVKDETLLHMCAALQTPSWLAELIMHAAGYASQEQRQVVQDKRTLAKAEQRVLQEIQQRENGF